MGKRRIATVAAAAAVAGLVAGATPASAATTHKLMLFVNSGISHIKIVVPPEEEHLLPGGKVKCVPVKAGEWTDANWTVHEGRFYSFQAFVLADKAPEVGSPCGARGLYLGPSVDSPLTIKPTKTPKYREKISLG